MEYAYILPLGDMHIGDPAFSHRKFGELRDWILQEPNTFVILTGDIMNCATRGSVSDIYAEKMNPTEARNFAFELLEPLAKAGKILAMVGGNHEFRIYKESGFDIGESLADKLQIPYSQSGLLLNMKFDPYPEHRCGKISYTCYVTHGFGGGATKGGKINVVNKLASIVLADIYICGHIHFMSTFKDSYFVPDPRSGKVNKMTRTYVSAGSFLDWGGYSERMGLAPAKLGTPRIRLGADRKAKNVHVSI